MCGRLLVLASELLMVLLRLLLVLLLLLTDHSKFLFVLLCTSPSSRSFVEMHSKEQIVIAFFELGGFLLLFLEIMEVFVLFEMLSNWCCVRLWFFIDFLSNISSRWPRLGFFLLVARFRHVLNDRVTCSTLIRLFQRSLLILLGTHVLLSSNDRRVIGIWLHAVIVFGGRLFLFSLLLTFLLRIRTVVTFSSVVEVAHVLFVDKLISLFIHWDTKLFVPSSNFGKAFMLDVLLLTF